MPTLLNLFTQDVVEACSGASTKPHIQTLRKIVNSDLGVTVVLNPRELTFQFQHFHKLIENSFSATVRLHSEESLSVTTKAKHFDMMDRTVVFGSIHYLIDFLIAVHDFQTVDVTAKHSLLDLNYA